MSKSHFSRKERQLRYLVKRLHLFTEKESNKYADEIRKIIHRIKILVEQLQGILSIHKLKRILGSVALLIGVSFNNSTSAQSFAPPTLNPFGHTPSYVYFTVPALADLDDDGDLDFLANTVTYNQYGYGQTFVYEQNLGSPTSPQFSLPLVNPFGLSPSADSLTLLQFHNLVDMDNDGDYDLLVNALTYDYDTTTYYAPFTTEFKYYENIGSSTNPMFTNTPISSPFGLIDRQAINIGELVDIDNDGDMDMISQETGYGFYYTDFVFFENIGNASNPQFATPQTNPFGLTTWWGGYYGVSAPAFIDIDGDGDMDLLSISYGIGFRYFENTGSPSNPQFSLAGANPFGLIPDTSDAPVKVIEVGDMDNDGDMDIMVGQYYGNILYYENTSNSSTNINEEADLQLTVYPNPATNHINIQSNKAVEQIDIFNSLGQKVISEINPKTSINLKGLSKGTYFIEIFYKNNKLIRKFTK